MYDADTPHAQSDEPEVLEYILELPPGEHVLTWVFHKVLHVIPGYYPLQVITGYYKSYYKSFLATTQLKTILVWLVSGT